MTEKMSLQNLQTAIVAQYHPPKKRKQQEQ